MGRNLKFPELGRALTSAERGKLQRAAEAGQATLAVKAVNGKTLYLPTGVTGDEAQPRPGRSKEGVARKAETDAALHRAKGHRDYIAQKCAGTNRPDDKGTNLVVGLDGTSRPFADALAAGENVGFVVNTLIAHEAWLLEGSEGGYSLHVYGPDNRLIGNGLSIPFINRDDALQRLIQWAGSSKDDVIATKIEDDYERDAAAIVEAEDVGKRARVTPEPTLMFCSALLGAYQISSAEKIKSGSKSSLDRRGGIRKAAKKVMVKKTMSEQCAEAKQLRHRLWVSLGGNVKLWESNARDKCAKKVWVTNLVQKLIVLGSLTNPPSQDEIDAEDLPAIKKIKRKTALDRLESLEEMLKMTAFYEDYFPRGCHTLAPIVNVVAQHQLKLLSFIFEERDDHHKPLNLDELNALITYLQVGDEQGRGSDFRMLNGLLLYLTTGLRVVEYYRLVGNINYYYNDTVSRFNLHYRSIDGKDPSQFLVQKTDVNTPLVKASFLAHLILTDPENLTPVPENLFDTQNRNSPRFTVPELLGVYMRRLRATALTMARYSEYLGRHYEDGPISEAPHIDRFSKGLGAETVMLRGGHKNVLMGLTIYTVNLPSHSEGPESFYRVGEDRLMDVYHWVKDPRDGHWYDLMSRSMATDAWLLKIYFNARLAVAGSDTERARLNQQWLNQWREYFYQSAGGPPPPQDDLKSRSDARSVDNRRLGMRVVGGR